MHKRWILIFLFLFLTIISRVSFAESEIAVTEPRVYFFFSETCPHCRHEHKYLLELEKKHPEVKIQFVNIHEDFNLFKSMSEKYRTKAAGVPRTFIGDKVFVGFTPAEGELTYVEAYEGYYGYQNQIENNILELFSMKNEAASIELRRHTEWAFIIPILYILSIIPLRKKFKTKVRFHRRWIAGLIMAIVVSFFVFVLITPETTIKTFASSLPFPAFVVIISLADGFNPCAFTVLIILLSLLTYTQEKKSMAIIGGTFVVASGAMYFTFIMIMIFFGNWAIDRYGPTIMFILGTVVLIAGLINIKDYFFFKKGISLSISDKHKLRITRHASKITKMIKEAKTWRSLILAILGTLTLAIFVNLIELGCTAIFPAVYMVSLLQTYPESISAQVFWTVIYSAIYVVPLLVILIDFIYTFKSGRLTEKQGKILKLVSGIFMITFGIIMIWKPELLMFV